MSIIESLKKLVDPVAARDTAGELRSAREQPVRESQGAPPTYECRVCGYVGTDAHFCPTCLAATMRPTGKALPIARTDEAPGGAAGAAGGAVDESADPSAALPPK